MDNRSIFRKFFDWLVAGGTMKCIGRVITLIGVIVALVITGIGVVEMYKAAEADRVVAYEKAYVKQQKKEYKAKQKENEAAIKAGQEPPHVLPENVEDYEVEELPVVKLSLDDHVGPFITQYLVWAIAALAGGVLVGWVIGSIPAWIAAMKTAGPVRCIAEALFWAGVVVAAGFLLAGLLEILAIKKSTLPEVGKILMEKYLFWSVAALGCGLGMKTLILKGPKEKARVFESPKSNALCKWLYLIVIFLAIFALAACIMVGIRMGWATGLICAAVVGVIVLVTWLLSGVCPLVRTKEEIEAERVRRARISWVCDACGHENPRSVANCEQCGEVKARHHM